MKIFKYIGIALDWLGKNMSRVKTAGIIALTVLFIISICNNGCSRKEAEQLIERITGLNITNDFLSAKNKLLADSLTKEFELRRQLEFTRANLVEENKQLLTENSILKKKLNDIPVWLLNMPADSSYKFLYNVAYPFPGENRFPFNEPQVKNIHADYLENIQLHGLVVNLESQVNNCYSQYANRDSLIKSYQNSLTMALSQKVNADSRADNSEVKAALYEETADKQERRKKFWKFVAAGEGLALILLLL